MHAYNYTAIVTLIVALTCFWMGLTVARTHQKVGILAPVMTGDPILERTIRGHLNTLEWLPVFLPSLWLFAIYWSDAVAAALGLIWVAGRLTYFYGYIANAQKRFPGFFIQSSVAGVLLFGALGRIIYMTAIAAP